MVDLGNRRVLAVLAAMLIAITACAGPSGPGATGTPAGSAPTATGTAAASQPSAGGTVTLGSNASDDVPKRALQAMVDHCEAELGITVTINTTDHGAFQDAISSYLQGTPDDVFTWFAGYRMQFFAQQGLATSITDVWDQIGPGFSDAFHTASKGLDDEYYFVPILNYPWA